MIINTEQYDELEHPPQKEMNLFKRSTMTRYAVLLKVALYISFDTFQLIQLNL